MNIDLLMAKRHSKHEVRKIADWIGNDPDRFVHLANVFFGDSKGKVQRSAWVMSEVGMRHPNLFLPYMDAFMAALDNPKHDAVQRNILKVIADTQMPLSEDIQGELVGKCFDLLLDPKRPVAIHVHAMQCIANYLPQYPDLAVELKTIIEDGMEEGSAGFRSRGRKILKQIGRIGY